jgi:hypothetical protein
MAVRRVLEIAHEVLRARGDPIGWEGDPGGPAGIRRHVAFRASAQEALRPMRSPPAADDRQPGLVESCDHASGINCRAGVSIHSSSTVGDAGKRQSNFRARYLAFERSPQPVFSSMQAGHRALKPLDSFRDCFWSSIGRSIRCGPYRVVMVFPDWDTSQNLLDVPFTSLEDAPQRPAARGASGRPGGCFRGLRRDDLGRGGQHQPARGSGRGGRRPSSGPRHASLRTAPGSETLPVAPMGWAGARLGPLSGR